SHLRVLIAEDNLVNRRLVTRVLEKRGHTVSAAATGREALDQVQHERFDVILMDVQMPDMDGLETAAAIRRLEAIQGAHTPIIAVTAYSMKGDRERCLAAGMDDYITKPINAQELAGAVESTAARATKPYASTGTQS